MNKQRLNSRRFLCLAALVTACAGAEDSTEEISSTAAAISFRALVPEDVNCIEITATGGNSVTRRFEVTAGGVTNISLTALPIGAVTFVGVAWPTECAAVTPTSEATWATAPTRFTLAAGVETAISLAFRRVSGVRASLRFKEDGIACGPSNQLDCDGVPANGCETDINTSAANCGACGTVCAFPNSTPVCASARCELGTCVAGYGNCNGTASDGCEAPLNTLTNCGTCGASCVFPHVRAGAVCASGRCAAAGPLTCESNWADCDGVLTNGCETSLQASPNCGACGAVCPTSAVCSQGAASASGTFACHQPNDFLRNATAVDLSLGANQSLPFNTVTAQSDVTPCTGFPSGPEVFYQFTLRQSEIVYADSFGASGPVQLYFARASDGFRTDFTPYCSPSPSLNINSNAGCAAPGARIAVALAPGIYYLVVQALSSTPVSGTIHFQHLPTSADTGYLALPSGRCAHTEASQSTGSGGSESRLSASCASSPGRERSYFFVTCPEFPSTRIGVDTCRADFDTVLSYSTPSGSGNACNDNAGLYSCGTGGTGSAFVTYAPAGAGLHLITVDGRTAAANGSFTLSLDDLSTCE